MAPPDRVFNSLQLGAWWTAASAEIVSGLVPERVILDPLHHDAGHHPFLPYLSWTKIVRHYPVTARHHRMTLPLPSTGVIAAVPKRRRRWAGELDPGGPAQRAVPLCKQALITGAEYEPDSPREWINWFAALKKMLHKHHFVYRRDGGSDERTNLRLVHADCHRQHHAGDGGGTTSLC